MFADPIKSSFLFLRTYSKLIHFSLKDSAHNEVIAVVFINWVFHLRKPQFLNLIIFFLFSQLSLLLMETVTHVGHLIIEVDQKELLLLHRHEERQLKQFIRGDVILL